MKTLRHSRAFTLIEIMIVVAIMGIILSMGVPAMVRAFKKEGMRKAVSDLVEGCNAARASAILSGQDSELIIRPIERTLSAEKFSATLPDNVAIEILGVNFVEYQESEEARVRFHPNGTSDEFAIVLVSDDLKSTKITLEILTGLAHVEVLR